MRGPGLVQRQAKGPQTAIAHTLPQHILADADAAGRPIRNHIAPHTGQARNQTEPKNPHQLVENVPVHAANLCVGTGIVQGACGLHTTQQRLQAATCALAYAPCKVCAGVPNAAAGVRAAHTPVASRHAERAGACSRLHHHRHAQALQHRRQLSTCQGLPTRQHHAAWAWQARGSGHGPEGCLVARRGDSAGSASRQPESCRQLSCQLHTKLVVAQHRMQGAHVAAVAAATLAGTLIDTARPVAGDAAACPQPRAHSFLGSVSVI
eukprot:360804-Chlamydomonas_euryale.AAC.7